MSEVKYKKAYFHIDDLKYAIEGYYNQSQLWNGWACPCFTKKVIDEFILKEDVRRFYKYEYNSEIDTYFVYDLLNTEDDPEEYEGRDVLYDDKYIHVYDLGAWSWIWSVISIDELIKYHIKLIKEQWM